MQDVYETASNRIRRRLEIMRLDMKMQGLTTLKHDVDEINALLDVMDEQHGNESASSRIKGSKP